MIRILWTRYGRLIRFILVGGATTALYSLLVAGLSASHLAPDRVAASFLASAVTIPVSFFAHRRVTYQDTERSAGRPGRFLFIGLVNLLCNLGLMRSSELLGWPIWSALVAGWVFIPLVNFALNTVWVFRAKHLMTLDG